MTKDEVSRLLATATIHDIEILVQLLCGAGTVVMDGVRLIRPDFCGQF